jgi:acid phosphatase type 7
VRLRIERLGLLAVAAVFVVGLSSSVGRGNAATQTLAPTDDTYASFTDSTTPQGSRPYVRIRADSSGSPKRTFLKFSVSGVSGPVTSATLRIYSIWNSASGIQVRSAATNWSEQTLTWVNAPAYSSTVTAASTSYPANVWISLNVTPLVTGNGTYSFALTTPSGETMLASKEGGAATAPQLLVQTSGSPSNTSPPSVSGTAQDGQTLSANAGSWSGDQPIGFAYQWRRCDSGGGSCADINGAGGQSYALTSADVGSTIRVAVTGSNSAGSSSASSAASAVVTGVPPANTSPPSVSGTAQQMQTLSAGAGSWSGTLPIGFAYQWRRCDSGGGSCADISGASGQSYMVGSADVGSTIRVAVTGSNAAGSSSASSAPTSVVTAADPVVGAAGDIACDPADPNFNGGAGTASACHMRAVSDLLLQSHLTAVLGLGDEQYECAGLSAFASSYDPTWGRLRSITYPAPGNHEYQTSGGTNCDAAGNAAGYYTYFGSAAGDPSKGYYSFDLGTWHLIALNASCAKVGGCGAGSPEEIWLKNDLATRTNRCTLAFWHNPRYSSGGVGNDSTFSPFWQDLYNANAELVLVGHDHEYERFAPQNASSGLDTARGIREFVVGTGGKTHTNFATIRANSEVRNNDTFGFLKLTLHPSSYDWQFVPEPGKTFADSGSTACH